MIKKTVTVLVAFVAVLCSFSALAQSSGGTYIKYELNGRPVSFTGEDVSSYLTEGTKLSDDARDFTTTAGYVSTLTKGEYKLTFYINTAAKTKPTVGKMQLVSAINQEAKLPTAHLKVDRLVGKDDYTFYATTDNNQGNFEVTKVQGDWLEGTFDAVIPNQFDDNDKPLTITKGSFRIKMDKL